MVLVTNELGEVVSYTDYEPFGEVRSHVVIDEDLAALQTNMVRDSMYWESLQLTNCFVQGFNDQTLDTETGLIYLRDRYYDPSAGRFISMDPVRGVPSRY